MSHDKDVTLRIRCKLDVFRKFKKVAVDFNNYEEALIAIMDTFEQYGKIEGKYKILKKG